MATTKPRSRKANKAEPKSSGRLATYEAKRDFGITPEPKGSSQAAPAAGKKTAALQYVIQKHDARRMHYDLRLEVDGAMASWAVPRGPSYDPTVRRLAVQTEDHPMEYNAFEGRIPEGEGTARATCSSLGRETVPPGQERAMMEKGHMHVRLFGDKLVGDWHVIRTDRKGGDDGAGGAGKAQWLFFKAKDARANPAYDVVTERPESVVSGRQATAGTGDASARPEKGASARALLEAVGEPMLTPTPATSLFGPRRRTWIFEVKYDGYRLLAGKAGEDDARSTDAGKGNDWTERFRPIADAVGPPPLRASASSTARACVVDEAGRPSFQALQRVARGQRGARRASGSPRSISSGSTGGTSGRSRSRRGASCSRSCSAGGRRQVTYSRAAVGGRQLDLLEAARGAGLEGLMAKRKGSPYTGGRSSSWLEAPLRSPPGVRHPRVAAARGQRRRRWGALVLAVVDGGRAGLRGARGSGLQTTVTRSRVGEAARAAPGREAAGGARAGDEGRALGQAPSSSCEVRLHRVGRGSARCATRASWG